MAQLYIFTPSDCFAAVRALSEIGYHESKTLGYFQNGNSHIRISKPVKPDFRKLYAAGIQSDARASSFQTCMEFNDSTLPLSLSREGQDVLSVLVERLSSAIVVNAKGDAYLSANPSGNGCSARTTKTI